MLCEHRRYLDTDEYDALMRNHGMKRVYKPREFHAKPWRNGYRGYCSTCDITWYTDNQLPHDYAITHAQKYHRPTFAAEVTEVPFGSTLGLNGSGK